MAIKEMEELFKTRKGHTYIQWMVAIVGLLFLIVFSNIRLFYICAQLLYFLHSIWKAGIALVCLFFLFLANSTLLTYGLQAGWVSPVTNLLQSDKSPTGSALTDTELSWVASILCVSAAFSVPLYAFVADKYGRKFCIILITIFQAISWIMTIAAKSSFSLICARFCCGIAAGGCFNIVPIYVKEISQDNIRGLLGSLLMMFANIGILMMFVLGVYLEYFTVLWIVLTIPVVAIVFMVKFPESPSFLVKIGDMNKATKTVAYLRGLDKDDKQVQNEISVMKNENLYYQSLPDISFGSILKNKAWCRSFVLAMAIMTVQAGNGNFAILTYASTILGSFGVTVSPQLQSVSLPLMMILGSLVSMSCIERFGRKPLLLLTLAITVAAMASIATTLLLHQLGYHVPSWIPVVSLVTAVFIYAVGASPVPYIVMAEMFNFQIRSKVIGYVVTYAWGVSFTILATFAPMASALSVYSTFYLYAAINLFGFFIALIFLPETRGKSVEDIEKIMGGT